MAWQQAPYPQQSAVPPPGYYTGGSYPDAGGAYPGAGYSSATANKPFPDVGPAFAAQRATAEFGATNPAAGNLAFSDKTIRNGFIRKVYSILMVQLAISAAFIALFVYNDRANKFAANNRSLVYVAMIITFVVLIAMSCCESARRVAPTNYVCLLIFTLAESFMLGVICSYYKSQEVLLAVGICAVICFALTVFAFQTKIDFTVCGATLMIAVLVLFIFGIILIFFPSNTGRYIYACIGAFLFSAYLVYDTQLLIGGSHKYSISPEEYVFAALNLYIDVVQIFLMILSILGSRD